MTDDIHLSDEEIKGFRLVFNQIDTNHNGLLDKLEFKEFLLTSHIDVSFYEAVFKVFDKDQDGEITFNEFVEYIKICMKTEKEPRYLYRRIFDSLDTDHDGNLQISELIEFGRLFGKTLTESQIKEEIANHDINKDSMLDFEEMCVSFNIPK